MSRLRLYIILIVSLIFYGTNNPNKNQIENICPEPNKYLVQLLETFIKDDNPKYQVGKSKLGLDLIDLDDVKIVTEEETCAKINKKIEKDRRLQPPDPNKTKWTPTYFEVNDDRYIIWFYKKVERKKITTSENSFSPMIVLDSEFNFITRYLPKP